MIAPLSQSFAPVLGSWNAGIRPFGVMLIRGSLFLTSGSIPSSATISQGRSSSKRKMTTFHGLGDMGPFSHFSDKRRVQRYPDEWI